MIVIPLKNDEKRCDWFQNDGERSDKGPDVVRAMTTGKARA
jgi:hypothetical protein